LSSSSKRNNAKKGSPKLEREHHTQKGKKGLDILLYSFSTLTRPKGYIWMGPQPFFKKLAIFHRKKDYINLK
jgi:hypothetical protein